MQFISQYTCDASFENRVCCKLSAVIGGIEAEGAAGLYNVNSVRFTANATHEEQAHIITRSKYHLGN